MNKNLDDAAWLTEAYLSGRSVASLAAELDAACGTVRRRLVMAGVSLRNHKEASWARGKTKPDSTKAKMSAARKRFWEANPDRAAFRAKVSRTKLAGKPPKPNPLGYIRVPDPGRPTGQILEHRLVMEQAIGRRLLRCEVVHHKDGNRSNNDLSNLELWSSSHPYGQRVRDKLAWARDIVRLYDSLPEAMKQVEEDKKHGHDDR